jgi:hypothetical protein
VILVFLTLGLLLAVLRLLSLVARFARCPLLTVLAGSASARFTTRGPFQSRLPLRADWSGTVDFCKQNSRGLHTLGGRYKYVSSAMKNCSCVSAECQK